MQVLTTISFQMAWKVTYWGKGPMAASSRNWRILHLDAQGTHALGHAVDSDADCVAALGRAAAGVARVHSQRTGNACHQVLRHAHQRRLPRAHRAARYRDLPQASNSYVSIDNNAQTKVTVTSGWNQTQIPKMLL